VVETRQQARARLLLGVGRALVTVRMEISASIAGTSLDLAAIVVKMHSEFLLGTLRADAMGMLCFTRPATIFKR